MLFNNNKPRQPLKEVIIHVKLHWSEGTNRPTLKVEVCFSGQVYLAQK